MSEICCTRLAENTGCKKLPYGHHRTALSGCIFATMARIDNRKKQQYLLHMPHNMVNFGPLAAEIDWWVWRTPANFNGFRVLPSLLHRHRSTEANQTLHDVWPFPGLVDYLYVLPCNGILPGAKFTSRPPSLALSYIGNVTARHSSSGCEPNFVRQKCSICNDFSTLLLRIVQ